MFSLLLLLLLHCEHPHHNIKQNHIESTHTLFYSCKVRVSKTRPKYPSDLTAELITWVILLDNPENIPTFPSSSNLPLELTFFCSVIHLLSVSQKPQFIKSWLPIMLHIFSFSKPNPAFYRSALRCSTKKRQSTFFMEEYLHHCHVKQALIRQSNSYTKKNVYKDLLFKSQPHSKQLCLICSADQHELEPYICSQCKYMKHTPISLWVAKQFIGHYFGKLGDKLS